MNLEKISLYLIERRKENYLTQKDLAYKLGVSLEIVDYWESAKLMPTDSQLKALAEVYSVEVKDIIGDETYRPDKPTIESIVQKYAALGKISKNNVDKVYDYINIEANSETEEKLRKQRAQENFSMIKIEADALQEINEKLVSITQTAERLQRLEEPAYYPELDSNIDADEFEIHAEEPQYNHDELYGFTDNIGLHNITEQKQTTNLKPQPEYKQDKKTEESAPADDVSDKSEYGWIMPESDDFVQENITTAPKNVLEEFNDWSSRAPSASKSQAYTTAASASKSQAYTTANESNNQSQNTPKPSTHHANRVTDNASYSISKTQPRRNTVATKGFSFSSLFVYILLTLSSLAITAYYFVPEYVLKTTNTPIEFVNLLNHSRFTSTPQQLLLVGTICISLVLLIASTTLFAARESFLKRPGLQKLALLAYSCFGGFALIYVDIFNKSLAEIFAVTNYNSLISYITISVNILLTLVLTGWYAIKHSSKKNNGEPTTGNNGKDYKPSKHVSDFNAPEDWLEK